jgi:hypothetical protein
MKSTLVALLLSSSLALPTHARMVSGIPLSETIEVDGTPLALNGAALQKVLMFKLYTVGLYLEEPTADASKAIGSDQVKHLRLHVLHSLSKKQISGAIRDGFVREAAGGLPALQDRLQQLLGSLRDVEKGEELHLTYVPGTGTTIETAGERTVIAGKDFADALFAIWLGANTDVPKVKKGLLGG